MGQDEKSIPGADVAQERLIVKIGLLIICCAIGPDARGTVTVVRMRPANLLRASPRLVDMHLLSVAPTSVSTCVHGSPSSHSRRRSH